LSSGTELRMGETIRSSILCDCEGQRNREPEAVATEFSLASHQFVIAVTRSLPLPVLYPSTHEATQQGTHSRMKS
jgi:hypothetical protein